MIPRTLEARLREIAKKMPAVAVLGPRQSGKTTLVKMVFPNHLYVSLEDPDTLERIETDPRGFLEKATQHEGIILDEFQRFNQLASYLQGFIDRIKKPGFFILTGSQNYLMMQSISQSLAGRVALLKLLPLSLAELKAANLLSDDYCQVAWHSLYPRSYASNLEPRDWISSYLEQYVERDVRSILSIKDLRTFQRFIGLCAGRVGQQLNISSLAVEADINQATAKQWLSLLEASYLITLLQPWATNISKRLVKTPKLYFVDSGLVCALLKITSAEQLAQHYSMGSIFENMIVSELLKGQYNQGNVANLYFIRSARGEEVDVVLEHADHLRLVEIKATATIKTSLFKGLRYWNHELKTNTQCFLVHGGTQETEQSEEISIVSWQQSGSIAAN